MIKMSLLAILACGMVYAGPLSFESGIIKAHTEMVADKTIDPMFKKATSHLSMDASPSTLKGTMVVSISDFISDNAKRDEHMQEKMESSVFPKATFEIKEVVAKGGDHYALKGSMNLHGVTKPISFDGTVTEEGEKVHIKAASAMKMSDFGIEPPSMMFMSVRDQVDLNVDVVLKR
jgi:polyisoprenoid-binding protein YceI